MGTTSTPQPTTEGANQNATQDANQNLSLNEHGRNDLVRREGIVLHYYNDPVNNCTYGAGTLAHPGPCTPEEMRTSVNDPEVVTHLNQGIATAENAVRQNVTDRNLTQEQFNALVSFTYNVGARGARNVLRQVNASNDAQAVHTMLQYTHATVRGTGGQPLRDADGNVVTRELRGLVHRRHEEANPFRARQARP